MTTIKHEEKKLKKIAVSIEGLHCGSCVARLEAGLKPVPGIELVSVSLPSRTAFVTYDAAALDAMRISARIGELGYKAVGVNESQAGA